MSVYLPKSKSGAPRSQVYQFDFWLKPKGKQVSERFFGSTGQRTAAAAKRVENELRELAKLGQLNHRMTVEQACNQYWEEKMIRARSANDQATNLEHLSRCLGPDTLLVDVTPALIAQAAVIRARTPLVRYRKGSKRVEPTKNRLLPKPATVNRQVVETARRLLRYARTIWKVPIDLDEFKWSELRYEEPDEIAREIGVDEELRYWEVLRLDYHPILEMYLISGRRKSDWVMLPKFRVDLKAGVVRHRSHKRKQAKDLTVTLTARELEIIKQEWEKAPDCEYVFTYEVQRGPDKGKRRPINQFSLRSEHRRAREAAGLPDFRIHDCRHTFATRLLRAKGNLKLVQTTLDHTDIASTMKYVSVLDQEVTEARSEIRVSRTYPGDNVFPIPRKATKP